MQLTDYRTKDGWRHFASLPRTCAWQALSERILLLPRAEITSFAAAGETEARLDFTYQNHRFSVSQWKEEFCFLVHDPKCPDLNLCEVAYHCEQLLSSA